MDIPERHSSNSASLDQQDVESSLKIYRQVFNLCDKDGNGFITKEELAEICEQASDGRVNGVLDNVLQCLKPSHEGHISFEEFRSGFESFQRLHDIDSEASLPPGILTTSTPSKPTHPGNGAPNEEVFESEPVFDETEGAWHEVADRLDPAGTLTGTGVKEMWKDLYSKDPSLLENFESFLCEVVRELKQSDTEKSTLVNHIRKITEQHSREVSEMDHLLQEELQQVRANQEQNNASQTSRLSSHYTSLLAQREAVIGEMITQETDLKQALQHKTLAETQLREDKMLLHSENQDLREQLVSSEHSTPHHGEEEKAESGSEASLYTTHQGPESSLPSASRLMPTPPNFLDSEGSGYSLVRSQTEVLAVGGGARGAESGPRLDQELEHAVKERPSVVPESNLRLNVIEEDQEEDDIKYYPQRGFSEPSDVAKREEAMTQGGLHLDVPVAPPKGGVASMPESDLPPALVPSISVTNSTVQNGGMDLSLTYSGAMPRRADMPRPTLNQQANINRVFKVVFLGDVDVGKTSLIARLTEGQFKTSMISTVGLEFSTKTLRVGEEWVVFQLWDTAGQERFRNALTPVYFRRADAFIIVYDVSNRVTFKSTKKWISILKAALREQPSVVMLVGNKSDKSEKDRQVGLEEGQRLAVELQAMFSETSALSGDNVLQAHSTLAQLLLAREDADLREFKKHSLASRQEQKSSCSC